MVPRWTGSPLSALSRAAGLVQPPSLMFQAVDACCRCPADQTSGCTVPGLNGASDTTVPAKGCVLSYDSDAVRPPRLPHSMLPHSVQPSRDSRQRRLGAAALSRRCMVRALMSDAAPLHAWR